MFPLFPGTAFITGSGPPGVGPEPGGDDGAGHGCGTVETAWLVGAT